ncbi:MAG TPA: DNA-binding protein WhiA [Ruminococcaceae bacterium]|nr:DNA-binding protein WhiA [Oscillospiraceae bacterium]
MSFTTNVKDELCAVTDMNSCCYHAMTYGLLLFGGAFQAGTISISTEHEGTALLYAKAVGEIIGEAPPVKCSSAGKYSVRVGKADERKKILEHYGISENTIAQRINRSNLADDCCSVGFVRGVFLACSAMTEPQKSYQMEFVTPYLHLGDDLLNLLQDLNVVPKMTRRRTNYIVYLRNSEAIEDTLMALGAKKSALDIMQVKVEKDFRNKVNRRVNFETANIDRAVAASMEQLEAIRKLKRENRFDDLPEDLKELARLREEYPESSLRELGNLLSVSLSRSGVYHRLNKIIEFANNE